MANQQIYLDEFENLHRTMTTLAAQSSVQPFPDGITEAALLILARDLWEKHERMLGMFKEHAHRFGDMVDTLKDLQLSKEPELETLAREIYAAGNSSRPVDAKLAFEMASKFEEVKTQRRAARSGK